MGESGKSGAERNASEISHFARKLRIFRHARFRQNPHSDGEGNAEILTIHSFAGKHSRISQRVSSAAIVGFAAVGSDALPFGLPVNRVPCGRD
jgi:hypothetical protein